MTGKTQGKLFTAILIVGATYVTFAEAENWQKVGGDKDASGNDRRTIEIDLDSIKSASNEVVVSAIITTNYLGNVGYNCSEGEIRHGNVKKEIVDLICHKPSSGHRFSARTANWQTVRVDRVNNKELTVKIDLNSISRINDLVMVMEMGSSSARASIYYDCKGYFKMDEGKWTTLDLTDHIPTVPRGYVSLERKIANKICATSTRSAPNQPQ